MTGTYCQIRRGIEKRSWMLTSRHARLTERLLGLIGLDHNSFMRAMDDCRIAHMEISQSHVDLERHRREHGC